MKHTPLPKIGLGSVGTFKGNDFIVADDEAFISSEGEDPDYEIAVKGPEAKRMAEQIVRAVNSHDAMLSALKDAQSILADLTNPADGLVLITTLYARAREAELKARAAIAQATPTEG